MSASNGKEVKSALRYGQHVVRMANPGGKGLRFRKSSPGTCRGDVLGKATVELALGGDWVVVLTRFSPKKVVVWDALEAGLARIALRNGADLGTFGFKWAVPELEEPWFPVPVLDAPYVKGQWGEGFGHAPDVAHIFWAHRPPNQTPIAGPTTITPQTGRRVEMILIGTSLGNVRIKKYSVAQLLP